MKLKILSFIIFIFVYVFSYVVWANISFMNDSIISSNKYNSECKDNCLKDKNKTFHESCFDKLSDYWKYNHIFKEKTKKVTDYDIVKSEFKPIIQTKTDTNKDPPVLTTKSTFSFSDLVWIILILN